MPEDSFWHVDVRDLPVHPDSQDWVESIGKDDPLQAGFGADLVGGAPFGIPYRVVDADQPVVPVNFRFFLDSDPGPYPIPPDAPIEGGDADERRVVVLQRDTCLLYEISDADPQANGSWRGSAGAVFDLGSNLLRGPGRLSADDAGLPILPALVRYEEVALNLVGHALRFTAPTTRGEAQWPARNFTSSATSDLLPPMGAWFRLKERVDENDFSPGVRPIVRALKRHGMILADHGPAWSISGVPSEHWDEDDLAELSDLTGNDFEAVDVSSLIVAPDSGEVPVPDSGGVLVPGGPGPS
jgi:hypothetical protein